MKEFYKANKKSVVFLIISLAIFTLTIFSFFIIHIGNIYISFSVLEFPHLALAVSTLAIFFSVISLVVRYVEHRLKSLKPTYAVILYFFLLAVDIVLLVFIVKIIGSEKISLDGTEYIKQNFGNTMFFQVFPPESNISSIYEFWGILPPTALMVLIVWLLIYFLKHIVHVRKKITMIRLGFNYETCEYYKQTNVVFETLSQGNGTLGEFKLYRVLREHFDESLFIFNREIPKDDGLSTEIDLIMLHERGIFVLENKHYTTKIYGNATDHDLTIINHHGQKQAVYNPILQNENHVGALRAFLSTQNLYKDESTTPIHSIVVFTADWNDRTDDIISGINTENSKTKVCTSQNISFVINKIISETPDGASVDTESIKNLLSSLPVREKNT